MALPKNKRKDPPGGSKRKPQSKNKQTNKKITITITTTKGRYYNKSFFPIKL